MDAYIQKENYLESVEANFLLLPSYRRFPSDLEFQREMQTRDLYNSPRRCYWLRRLENHNRKERVVVDEYTIEHIMPQNEILSSEWRGDLGDDWERVQATWLHTLGNLTLTGYNSEYSDRSFKNKRDMKGGFKMSPLQVNQGIGELEKWDESAIKARANRLSTFALNVWQAPQLSESVLQKYRRQTGPVSHYSIDTHPNLLTSPNRELFEALSVQILDLNPCVTREYLKLYVAFKAETNFVDVVPQSKRLRLSINIDFNELRDPKGIAKDVTNLGRWGNGDTEVMLGGLDELPYVMGIVRQAFEQQMGNDFN